MARVILTAGLNYGDEGKGSTVDFLCRHHKAYLVVRYNGGSQAAHNVVTRDGAKHHTFSQFGSGTFAGAKTHLSRYMIVNPIPLIHEADGLMENGVPDPLSLMTIDEEALVTTPFHISANRIREAMRTGRHGSCGAGVGETMKDFVEKQESLFVKDLVGSEYDLRRKLHRIRDRKIVEMDPIMKGSNNHLAASEWNFLVGEDGKREAAISRIIDYYSLFTSKAKVVRPEWLEMMLESSATIVFEGAQGVLLDQDFGFQPYTTWTDCTFGNALKLLDGWKGEVKKLGIVRAYMTRHGVGPFVTEDTVFDQCSGHDHNKAGEWQGNFRSGAFDLVATAYALKVIGKIDGLVVTNLDRLSNLEWIPVCWAYKGPGLTLGEILVNRPFNLEYQMLQTRMIEQMKPVMNPRREHGNDYAWGLADSLGVNLALTSYGTTSDDKRIVKDLFPGTV
jgi:adenylosuccinate synthase